MPMRSESMRWRNGSSTRKKAGDQLVVVLSARAGETDRLIKLGCEITDHPDPREMDVLLATGEQTTIALFCIAVKAMGSEAVSMTGYQAGIMTDGHFGHARISWIQTQPIIESLQEGKIVVVAGFQGYDENGNITTLGRGGSDTTAVALAAALHAGVCEIYTDVEGVFTADPNVCSRARKLDKISYEEMMELASMGAKVLHHRSVEFGKKYDVPIMVLSSFTDAPGTLVTREDETMEKMVVSGITYNKNEGRVTITNVPDQPGIAAKVFRPIAAASINVDLIVQSPQAALRFALDQRLHRRTSSFASLPRNHKSMVEDSADLSGLPAGGRGERIIRRGISCRLRWLSPTCRSP